MVIHQKNEDKAYYVDSIGFKEIPFEQGEPYVPGWDKEKVQKIQHIAGISSPSESKAAVSTDKGYLTIQQVKSGSYEYSFYDKGFNFQSAGVISGKGMPLMEAINEVVSQGNQSISNEAVVYGDVVSRIEEKHKGTAEKLAEDLSAEKIADQLPPQSKRESILKSLREKQQKVNAEFGIGPGGRRLDKKKGEQML